MIKEKIANKFTDIMVRKFRGRYVKFQSLNIDSSCLFLYFERTTANKILRKSNSYTSVSIELKIRQSLTDYFTTFKKGKLLQTIKYKKITLDRFLNENVISFKNRKILF